MNVEICEPHTPSLFVITGIMASGKSTIAQLLAERFAKGVHVRGDVFRRMIVNGREEMSPAAPEEAMKQLNLRYSLAAGTADAYVEAGFTTVIQDVVIGDVLQSFIQNFQTRPLYLVVLCPRPDIVAEREASRGKKGYGLWTVQDLDDGLRQGTPRIGMWLDSSDMTPEETVDEIMRRAWTEAKIDTDYR